MQRILSIISLLIIGYLHYLESTIAIIKEVPDILNGLPFVIIYGIMLTIIIRSFFPNKTIFFNIVYCIVSLNIVYVGLAVLMNIFNYESETIVLFFKFSHPIPIETKVTYLLEFIRSTLITIFPELCENDSLYDQYFYEISLKLQQLERNRWVVLEGKNKKELEQLAYEIIIDSMPLSFTHLIKFIIVITIVLYIVSLI